ncbi:MAG: AraC family transcriptional regulator [Xanthobacteraceae bacterium]|nr:AraC family transcriptional regulator [Xanthobacteraceae bacterium]
MPDDVTPAPAEYLQNFPVLRSRDPDVFAHAMCSFGGTRAFVHRSGGFDAVVNAVKLDGVALSFTALEAGTVAEFGHAAGYRQRFVFAARTLATVDGREFEITAAQSHITMPGQSGRYDCSAGSRKLILGVDEAALRRKLAVLIGAEPRGDIGLAPLTAFDDPAARNLMCVVRTFARFMDTAEAPVPPIVLAEFEQLLLVSFLTGNRHDYRAILARGAGHVAPVHVRAVEDYIEANWDKPIALEDLVARTGIGATTLFRAFRLHRGFTPIAYVKSVRLRRARERLLAATPGTTVTATALSCGFSNLGHFARDYQRAFGEKPSATLANAMRRG